MYIICLLNVYYLYIICILCILYVYIYTYIIIYAYVLFFQLCASLQLKFCLASYWRVLLQLTLRVEGLQELSGWMGQAVPPLLGYPVFLLDFLFNIPGEPKETVPAPGFCVFVCLFSIPDEPKENPPLLLDPKTM